MLIDFILKTSLSAACKISDDLHSVLLGISANVTLSDDDSVNVAHILNSVVIELKVISSSNLKMHSMINCLCSFIGYQTHFRCCTCSSSFDQENAYNLVNCSS
jgi:hypothetical protein